MAATGEEEDMIPSSTVEVEECPPPSPEALINLPAPTTLEPPQVEEPPIQPVPGQPGVIKLQMRLYRPIKQCYDINFWELCITILGEM